MAESARGSSEGFLEEMIFKLCIKGWLGFLRLRRESIGRSVVGKEDNLLGTEHAKAKKECGGYNLYTSTLDNLVSLGTIGKYLFQLQNLRNFFKICLKHTV